MDRKPIAESGRIGPDLPPFSAQAIIRRFGLALFLKQ
jgi:hypothetical protein